MKKILCMFALIVALVCVVASCNKAPEENPLGLAFFLKDDATYVVEIGYAKYLSKIEIPATYNGKDVTEVRNFTSETLKEVVISKGVTCIGENAFENCTALTSVTIPDSVTSIGYEAFRNCTALTSVTIPDSVTSIGDSAFYYCFALTSVTIPDSVTSIGDSAFSGCNNLVGNEYDNAYYLGNDQNPYLLLLRAKSTTITSCTIHKDTRFIYDSAFSGCTSLTSVTFANPNGWECEYYNDATIVIAISASDLSNPATAAQYLKLTYGNFYWFRTE